MTLPRTKTNKTKSVRVALTTNNKTKKQHQL
jgi:hypothetical protein